ncbi:MAG: response regulator [Hormoscilla sp.]
MQDKSIKLLLVEDNAAEARLLQEYLKGVKYKQFSLVHVKRLAAARDRAISESFDIILLDLTLPDSEGLETLEAMNAIAPSLPIVVLTHTEDDELAVSLVRRGAQDYLVKRHLNRELLVRAVSYAIERQQAAEALRKANDELEIRVAERTAQLAKSNEELKAANKAKSEFLTNMSHELRTPLNSILGFTQVLQRADNLITEQKESIDIIYQSGNHLLTMINDILDLSKIEAGKMQLTPKDLHLPEFLEMVVEILQIKAEEKGILLRYKPTSELPAVIRADEKRLRQVLINLLGNAVKFTEKGGVTFKVEMKQVKESSPYPEASIRFEIADTGIGIAAAQLEKIFLPFEQVGNAQHKAEGTGLGLAISQKIVQMMGSSLKVKSQLGEGSIFWMDLDLPVVAGLPQSHPSLANSDLSGTVQKIELDESFGQKYPLRILLVDDARINQRVALMMFEKLGYKAELAKNGKEALEMMRRQSYDVVFMDIQMPEMDGLEATRHICQHWPESERPHIIAMTANAMPEDREKCLAAGMNHYISKPVRLETIVQVLRECSQ